MTTNNETIKRNEPVKEFLAKFLEKLEIERKITLHRKKILKKQNKMNRLARAIVYLESINLGIQAIKNIQFESVDDLASIKKLREAELFFSKTYLLEKFKFPDYKSQINPMFLTYADIDIQLDVLFVKSEDLLRRNCNLAAWEAKYLILDFRNLNRWYFKEKKTNSDEYQSRALHIVNETRPVLEQHRGFKEILINLILLIATLGAAFIFNKAVNGHFLFFQKTDNAKLLDTISQTLAAAKCQ